MKNKKILFVLIGVIVCVIVILTVTKVFKKEEVVGELEITPRWRNNRRRGKTDNDFSILYKHWNKYINARSKSNRCKKFARKPV